MAAALASFLRSGASSVRSSISATTASKGTPAAARSAWRASLFDASNSGALPRQRPFIAAILALGAELTAMRLVEVDDGRRGFFDRTAGDVDHRPAVMGKELARLDDFLAHSDRIDIGRIHHRMQD